MTQIPYNFQDLQLSEPKELEHQAIVFVYNGSVKYEKFLHTMLWCVSLLHKVDVFLVKPKDYKLPKNLLTKLPNINITPICLEDVFDYCKIITPLKNIYNDYSFHYSKPLAMKYIFDHMGKSLPLKDDLLYLDIDMLAIRNLTNLFSHINTRPLLVQEMGINLRHIPYHTLLNDPSIYQFFPEIRQRLSYPNKPVNTGVMGFKINRDKYIIDAWFNYTRIVHQHRIHSKIAWWDQGIFILVTEALNLLPIVSKNRSYNFTILAHDLYRHNIAEQPSNIIHFIGDVKPTYNAKCTDLSEPLDNVQIAVCTHNDEQVSDISPRKYLKKCNLNNLDYSQEDYRNNTFAESRIFLANDIYDKDKEILGCLTGSWNRKFFPSKIDHLYNNQKFRSAIKNINVSNNVVICANLCYGVRASKNAPLWEKNFQSHFRDDVKNTEFIQDKIHNVTGYTYTGENLSPYSNQIICHRNLFLKFKDYMWDITDKVISEFGVDFTFNGVADQRRPLSYVMEEISMLWWSKQNNIQYIPIVSPVDDWFTGRKYLSY